jgi:glycosyltransferase involved in cell wall biosynthesis
MQQQLQALGLADRPYAFYPANYWPHKNHRFLLTAYSIYRHRYPDRAWDLVFTGALASAEAELRAAAATMGLGDHVHFLGFLEESVLTAVWHGCQCLVFPSLYEGFGIPVLEAMMFGKPVIASNAGSLPEVGEDAVLYFDPRKPEELVAHWGTLQDDPEVRQTLVAKGQQRLQRFGDEVAMTQDYLAIFRTVIQQWRAGGHTT